MKIYLIVTKTALPNQPNVEASMPVPPKLLESVHENDAASHVIRDLYSVVQTPHSCDPPDAHEFHPLSQTRFRTLRRTNSLSKSSIGTQLRVFPRSKNFPSISPRRWSRLSAKIPRTKLNLRIARSLRIGLSEIKLGKIPVCRSKRFASP
jgi:hypothetical protein